MTDQAGVQNKPVEAETLPGAPAGSGGTSSGILSRHRLIELAEAYALVVLTLAMAIFFSVYGPTSELFPTAENLKVLAAQQGVLAVVALAALIPLVADEWDLSVGANAGLAAIFVASAMSKGASIPVAVALGIGLGLAVGVFNGLVVTKLRVNAVIPTLGTATIITGIITAKTGGLSIVSNIPAQVTNFGSGDVFSIPYIVIAMAVIAVLVYYLLEYTPFGRYIYAIGSNRPAAQLVGINNGRTIFLSFIAAGFLCGLAGSLQVARSSGVSPEVGEQLTLPALAAAFLSAASIRPGRYNVGGVLVAIFFLAVLNNGLNLAGAPNYINDLVNGLALIIGVGFGAVLGRRRMSGGA